jgi:hypothetical protein
MRPQEQSQPEGKRSTYARIRGLSRPGTQGKKILKRYFYEHLYYKIYICCRTATTLSDVNYDVDSIGYR